MYISVLLPYENASKYYEKWAAEEKKVNFEENPFEGQRCTVSYAAVELCTYLSKLGHTAIVSDTEGDFNIIIKAELGDSEEFEIQRIGNGIILNGMGRAGALYAVYEFLEAQGIRWYAPKLEYVPEGKTELVIPVQRHYKYDMTKGRGFHTEGLQKESLSLMTWMARNRMNMHAAFPNTVQTQKKLCIRLSVGGHVFTEILNPRNIEENGEYYIDTHRDWYGKREEEITAQNAIAVQFCATNTELLDRVSEVFIERAKNGWKNEEVFEVAGFDTWGRSCNCESCRKLGNGSDVALHYLSHIRNRINEATDKGEIKRRIYLCFDVYEGTDTMHPPINPVPQNLIDAGDFGLFCPILRCYKHFIDDESCDRNVGYKKDFEGWIKSGFPISINEYYNVSKFEDMPVLFTRTLENDVRYYIENGAERLVYMHVPMFEWGMIATTQYLLANITRDRNCNLGTLMDEYFENVFGPYKEEAKKAYNKVETALELASSWRSWGKKSCIGVLKRWDGKRPATPMFQDSHFENDIWKKGHDSIKLLSEAVEVLRGIRKKEYENISNYSFRENTLGVNPEEERRMQTNTVLLDKISEDIRGVLYAKDVWELMTLLADYYNELYLGKNAKAKITIEKIESLGAKMHEATFGMVYEVIPEFEVRDVLKRSQLKELYYKCIANKNQISEEN